MQFTQRALVLLLFGAVPVAASVLWPPALGLAVLYFLLLAGLFVTDLAISLRRRDFSLRRQCDSRLSLAAQNAIHLHLENHSRYAAQVVLRDETPLGFLADRWLVDGVVAPRSEAVFTYHLKPLRRGDYRFGDVNLRCRGRLGLIVRQMRFEAAAPVKVYPNLLDVRRYDIMAQRGLLAAIGLRNTRILGRGTEFERLRDYQADDDYRRINWKATARRGHPVSVEYETERSQNVMIMLDAGRLMAAPIGPLARLDYAVNTALMLAYVAVRMGDRVGLLAFADQVNAYLPPRRGRRQFLAMTETLYRMQAQYTEPDYSLAFRHFVTHGHKRSLVVLFTDLIDLETSRLLVSHIAALTPHHLTLCVTIADPGVTRMVTAAPVDSQTVYERAVAEDVLAERRRALQALRQRGALALDLPAESLTAAVINNYFELKTRTRL